MNSISELKNIVQSLDNNISDDDIKAFQKQISQIKLQVQKTPTLTTFLKMMVSLGKYLGAKKNNAHPDALPTLNSLTDQFEKLVNSPGLDQAEIRKIISLEIKNYRDLQNKIASKPDISDEDINELKAVILSIDWEVTETTLSNFERVITNLVEKFKNYKIHHTFLKIIYTTGRYIGNQKADAHTDSISFLGSVFKSFELLVHSPEMTFKDKKQILQNEINRFYEFKQKITGKTKKKPSMPSVLPSPKGISEDTSIQPALSHIKETKSHGSDKLEPLTTLAQADPGEIEPAPYDRQKPSSKPMDVMDDLFNIKESPADELLDAIHLQEVHGKNQDQAMNMLDSTQNHQPEGTRTFTPKRLDNEPIPEIENRLDEFFNLETPGQGPGEMPAMDDSTSEDPYAPDKDTDAAILARLLSTIEGSEWLQYKSSMLSVTEDIAYLEKRWKDDPEKTSLLKIINLVINVLQNQSKPIHKKIKGIFISNKK